MDRETHEKALRRAARIVWESPEGKILLDHLRSICGCGRELYTGSERFENVTYMLGRRSVILEIERLVKLHKETTEDE